MSTYYAEGTENIVYTPCTNMIPESTKIEDYLIPDNIIDFQSPAISEKAKEIVRTATDKIDKARCLYEWVRDKVPHSNDIGSNVLTCKASEALYHRTGMCFSKSHLLAAFLRSVHNPVGFCYQVLRYDPPVDNRLVLHGLNAVYISEFEKWIRVDARGNTGDVNAQFSLEEEQLAFPMDPSVGEFIYDTIYVSPVESVIRKLKKARTREEFWDDLPGSF